MPNYQRRGPAPRHQAQHTVWEQAGAHRRDTRAMLLLLPIIAIVFIALWVMTP